MSADNYLLIRKHPNGGYAVVMGFASDEYAPEVPLNHPSYPTLDAALIAAYHEEQEEVVEYGISIHHEVVVRDE